MRHVLLVTILLSSAAFAEDLWTQWGKDAQHRGEVPVNGQQAISILVNKPYDFHARAEKNETSSLLVHYQSVLLGSDDVLMAFKAGKFTSVRNWESQVWSERRFQWEGTKLVQRWRFVSDWKPVPYQENGKGPTWEPVFHAAAEGDFVYVPGFGGTVYKLQRSNGAVLTRFNPFGTSVNPRIFVSGPITVFQGTVYYNAMELSADHSWSDDVVNAWLVKITPDGTVSIATYASLTPDAPKGTAKCDTTFAESEMPWPPSPTAEPPKAPCGSQRPGLNVAPAISPKGIIYTVSRAHFNDRYGYLIAVRPNLTLRWAASLRGRLNDGCNVSLPANGTPGGCREGATTGVDPATNDRPAARVSDVSSASPVVTPDGAILYGASTRYNFSQGHLLKFGRKGRFLRSYPFGWDTTPGIYTHDGTYSIVIKENHYNAADFDRNQIPGDPEAYYITQLSRNLEVQWRYQNTNTMSCHRGSTGQPVCVDDHPRSFEWCVNALVVDSDGTVYANSEDGNLYVIEQGGILRESLFLRLAVGAAYTPISIGPDGLIYTQNDGRLFVVGEH